VWVLAVTEGTPTALGCVVGEFPGWVVEEDAQPLEVVEVQMLLLPAEWRQRSTLGVILADAVPLLGVRRSAPQTMAILPNGEPRLQEGTRDAERRSNRAIQ
jgi:hypothetical protein